MKKTGILCVCILAVLLFSVVDSFQKKKERQAKEEQQIFLEIEKEEQIQEEMIRVLIKTDEFQSEYHDSILLTSEKGCSLKHGNLLKEYGAGEQVEISMESGEFLESEVLYLESEDEMFCLPKLKRGQECPIYHGKMEVWKTQDGLLLINELPLESYLCAVVPSEMPASYPEEALKAQAVCARTYAKKQKEQGRMETFHADVDDSVSFQVYNNQPQDERTDAAVRSTEGIVLEKDGELLDAWYYSTSCGMDMTMNLEEESVFAAFLTENQLRAYEAEEPWYRWQTVISMEEFPDAKSMEVEQRNKNGRVESLLVKTSQGEEIIEGEYTIRDYLCGEYTQIVLQDGSLIGDMNLLPSAFFVMNPIYEGENVSGYRLLGGGYGHGNGMSQNGAKGMAEAGFGYVEILESYYGTGTCLAQMPDA